MTLALKYFKKYIKCQESFFSKHPDFTIYMVNSVESPKSWVWWEGWLMTQKNSVPKSAIPFRILLQLLGEGDGCGPWDTQIFQDLKCLEVCQIYVREHAFHVPLDDITKHKSFFFSRSFILTLPLSRVAQKPPNSPYLTLNGSIM